jgi:predicted nucleotidyltransferase
LKHNIHKLKKEVPYIKRVILFGSYARQKPHFGSDVDLLIIVSKRTKNDFEKIYETLFDISLEYEWSPLILSKDHFQRVRTTYQSFFKGILEEGIVIWSENQ